MAHSGGVRKKKPKDKSFSKTVILLKNDDQACLSFSRLYTIRNTPEQYKKGIEFASWMTEDDVTKKIIEIFPYLENKRFSCAASVKLNNDHKKYEFHGSPHVWSGETIRENITGNSSLYIFELKASQQTSTDTYNGSNSTADSNSSIRSIQPASGQTINTCLDINQATLFQDLELLSPTFQMPHLGDNSPMEVDDDNQQGISGYNNYTGNPGILPTYGTLKYCSTSGDNFTSGISEGNFDLSEDDLGKDNWTRNADIQLEVSIVPERIGLQGGKFCRFNFKTSLPSGVQSGSYATFGHLGTVALDRLKNSLIGECIPASVMPGLVTVTVKSQCGVTLGETKILYVDKVKEVMQQIVKDPKLQYSLYSELELASSLGNNPVTSNNGELQNSENLGSTQPFRVLQLLLYEAAESGAQQFIEMIFNSSAGRVIFDVYKDRCPLPEVIARNYGHQQTALYLEDITTRFCKEIPAEGPQKIDWSELKAAAAEAVQKQHELSVASEERNHQPESDENSDRDYYGDAESLSGDLSEQTSDSEDDLSQMLTRVSVKEDERQLEEDAFKNDKDENSLQSSLNSLEPQIIKRVPHEIKARGPRARLAFQNALMTGKVTVYRSRIMLIGQDQAGKTSLKSLLCLPFDTNQQSTERTEVDLTKFVDQVKNWQCTDEKLNMSQFVLDLLKMVNEKVKEEVDGEEEEEEEEEEAQDKQIEESLLRQVHFRMNRDTDMGVNQTEKTQEGQGVPLMASNSKNGELVTPKLNIQADLPDLLVQQTEETTMTLDLWDFAGQHFYYASYPALLSPRPLYMLVYNLNKGVKDTVQPCFRHGIHDKHLGKPNDETNLENLLSWLVSVRTMCSSNPEVDGNKESRKYLPYLRPPIFIVGTHADKPHQDIKQLEKQIQKEISGKLSVGHVIHPFFFSIDNTQGSSGEEIGKLQKQIIEVLKEEPYMGEEVPLQWFRFEKIVDALVAEERNYLDLKELQTIIKKDCYIESEDEAATMLDFYHDLGKIVRHRNTVVLKAQWLIDVFKRLITIPLYNNMDPRHQTLWEAMEETGALSKKLVDQVFSEFCLKTREDILNMLEQFGLIVKFGEMYFVPCQLRKPCEDLCKKEPSPSDPCPLYFRFLRGFVPHGLFSHLVSRCTRWCSESGFKQPPNLSDRVAEFFIEKELIHLKLILVCKKRFIKIVLKQMDQEHIEVSSAMAKVGEVPIMVRKFLEDTMQNLTHKLPWLKNLTYELCVKCHHCPTEEAKICHNHGNVSCTHEDCMCSLNLVLPNGRLSYCPNSSCDTIVRPPQLEKWFSIRGEERTPEHEDDTIGQITHGEGRTPGHETPVNNKGAAIGQMTDVVVKEGSPSYHELEGLSRRITDWKSLGRRLNFDEGILHGFHKDKEEWSEKAFAMLLTWKQREGSAATYEVLSEALRHEYVKRTDLAEEICCSCKP